MSRIWPETIPNFVNGEETANGAAGTLDVINPHNGEVLAKLTASGPAQVNAAVAAAKAAQPAWADTPAVARGALLYAACNLLEQREDELAEIVAMEAGKRISEARGEAKGAVACARFFAAEGQRLFGRTMGSGMAERWNMTIRAPRGVAALIIAANTPAPNFAWKVFPALICGNGVVLKPAEDTPISAWFMARTLQDAGLPPGVLNLVHGLGRDTGPALTAHPDVDVISFTGSTAVGRQIAETGGKLLKRVSLELGGKNAFVICDDADLHNAVRWAALSAFSNAGQRCAAGSRFIVQAGIYDRFRAALLEKTAGLKLGVDDDCDLGPVINQRQLDRMCGAVERARATGASVIAGGGRVTEAPLASGYYMQPTILEGAMAGDEISREELFGPIATLYRVSGFDEALALANNSDYGLTATIHTSDVNKAMTFCRKIRTGVVTVNGGTFGSEPHMPFGGYKASGNGTREPGTEALDVYSELKDVYLNIAAERIHD